MRSESKQATGVLVLALAGLLAYAARIFDMFGRRFTDDDQTVFWYAAREFLHLHVREPCFYGQAYNTLVASVPAAVLIGFGMPEWVAVPLIALAAGLTPWLLLAHVCLKAGKLWLACVVLALPLLLPPAYFMVLCLASYNEGLLMVVAAYWLGHRSSSISRFGATLLLVLGLIVTPNSIVVAVPVVVVLARRWWWERRVVVPVAAGALTGVGYKLGINAFYASHPAYKFHPDWELRFAWSDFVDGVTHLSRHWGDLSPLPALPWLNAAVVLLAVVALLVSRRWSLAAALLCVLAVAFGSLGINKVHDGSDSVFFSYTRMYLGLPLLSALSLSLASDSLPRRIGSAATIGVLVLWGAGAVFRQATLQSEVERTLARPVRAMSPVTTKQLVAECRQLDRLARREGAKWIFDIANNRRAYGCSALNYGRQNSLFLLYERRTWLLQEASRDPVTKVILTEAEPGLCARIDRSLACREVNRNLRAVVISAPSPRPALDFARSAGLVVRPF
jgi:hypothetical protein